MPLMLLDDVMSELDADRRELLAAASLSSGGQSVIATTGPRPRPRRGGEPAVTRLRVSPGARRGILQEALAA